MVLLTLFTYTLGKFGYSGLGVALIILLTVVIKGTFVIRDYMELKDVSFVWRAIMYGWLWGVVFVLAIIYTFSL